MFIIFNENLVLKIVATILKTGKQYFSLHHIKYSLLHVVQTGPGVYPTFYPMATGGSFPSRKVAGA
jgi:hypothetical protein